MSKLLSYQTFASASAETVPKTSFVVILMLLTFVPVSNETVPKLVKDRRYRLNPFAPVTNKTVPKPHCLLFSFQQLTINISSPIVVI